MTEQEYQEQENRMKRINDEIDFRFAVFSLVLAIGVFAFVIKSMLGY